jgi:ribonuclease P protein component
VVVSRRFGKAVHRNKAKRIARSLFDQFKKTINQSCDMLFFPNINFLTEPPKTLMSEFDLVLGKINK